MQGEDVNIIGQLKNVVMIGPDRNVNSADYTMHDEERDKQKAFHSLQNRYIGEI